MLPPPLCPKTTRPRKKKRKLTPEQCERRAEAARLRAEHPEVREQLLKNLRRAKKGDGKGRKRKGVPATEERKAKMRAIQANRRNMKDLLLLEFYL